MANTEILKALRCVREAEDAVTEALGQPELTRPQKILLNKLSNFLGDLDYLLLRSNLNKSIGKLEKKSKKLATLNLQAQKKLSKLKTVIKPLNAVSKIADGLVNVTKTLAKVGLG